MIHSALLATDGSVYGVSAAIVIAIAGFGYTIYNGVRTDRRGATSVIEQALNQRINDLVRQVEEAKAEAQECARERKALANENLELMRKVLRLENGHDT